MKKRRHTQHGMSGHHTYKCFKNIKQRCLNPNHPQFKDYGGRGIKLYPEWVDRPDLFLSWVFQNLGDRPTPKHEIDRIDNNGHYEPGNLRWATRSQQQRNKSTTCRITVGGVTLPLSRWSELHKINPYTIHWRLRHGWHPVNAVTVPAGGQPQMTELPQSVQRWREQAKEALRSLAPLCRANQIPPKLRPLVYALSGVHRATTVEAAHRAAKSAQLGFPTVEEIKILDSLSPAILDAFATIGEIEFESLSKRLSV